MIFAHLITAAVLLQLAVSEPVSNYKPLTEEEAARLAAWTPESKQQIWELSGQFEGDIVLPRSRQRNGCNDTRYRWLNREIPYDFSNDFSEQEKNLVMTTLTTQFGKTCVTLRLRQPSDGDYVHITGKDSGCWSHAGRTGGAQPLNLSKRGCLRTGLIVHEFLHAAGFYHQHSATDRDDWIDIRWENVQAGRASAFAIYPSATSFGQPYDYNSVMHYERYAWSKNGKPTIVPKDPSARIGQTVGLSNIDIIKLNKMYNCA